jgi:hypothetical protein
VGIGLEVTMNAALALRDHVEEPVAPRRPWLLALGVGVTAGAVGVAVGMGLGMSSNPPAQPQADYRASLQQEHLAQAPVVAGFSAEQGLAKEHLAQAPGGLPRSDVQ